MTDDDMDYTGETGLLAHDTSNADVDAPAASSEDESPSFLRWLLELVVMVALAFALATVVRTFVVQPYIIPSGSMVPTIEISERVLANKFIYRFESPKRGDVVVFDDPTKTVPTLIKRVVATEGETVDLIDGKVYVDGVALDEPYTYGKPSEPAAVPMPFTVPAGHIWVMGDNRTNSADSRVFGAVPLSSIDGRAVLRIWPLNRFAKL
ncbi:MAG: signal peptidase I [Coriobacteriia bacterium]